MIAAELGPQRGLRVSCAKPALSRTADTDAAPTRHRTSQPVGKKGADGMRVARRWSTGAWLRSSGRGRIRYASSCGAWEPVTSRSGAWCGGRRSCRMAGARLAPENLEADWRRNRKAARRRRFDVLAFQL